MTIERAVDPTIPPAQRETLSARPVRQPKRVSLDDMVALDIENLMLIPAFRRFCFTIFRDCGMYTGSFHSEAAFLAYAEGRRSLGLDILGRLAHASPDAHIAILTEVQPLQEASNGRRKRYDRNDLDGDGDYERTRNGNPERDGEFLHDDDDD